MRKLFNFRSLVAGATCLAVALFASCGPIDNPFDGGDPGDEPTGDFQTISGYIAENTVLKDLGLPIDYVMEEYTHLIVDNNATLTIEPGVTIQFTTNGYGIDVRNGATIKAVGTAAKPIKFIGSTADKTSWAGIRISTAGQNEFKYVEFLNGGYGDNVIYLSGNDTRAGFSHCKIDGGQLGMYVNGKCELLYFDNNVIENCELPIHLYHIISAEHFDLTSQMANNEKPYIVVDYIDNDEALTLNTITVPYAQPEGWQSFNPSAPLTIEEGNTFYFGAGGEIYLNEVEGVLTVNGTVANPVTFTRMPGSVAYWEGIYIYNTYAHSINNAVIEYGGGYDTGWNIHVRGDDGEVTLNNVAIRNSKQYGIVQYYTGPVINHTGVTFANNPAGNFGYYGPETGYQWVGFDHILTAEEIAALAN